MEEIERKLLDQAYSYGLTDAFYLMLASGLIKPYRGPTIECQLHLRNKPFMSNERFETVLLTATRTSSCRDGVF
jgi:hypothetical protein